MSPRPPARVIATAVFCCTIGLAGCQIGPSALKVSSSQYSDAMRVAMSEQMLVNLVRLRYRDLPVFLGVSNISTQFEFEQSGSISGNIIENVGAGGAKTPDSLGLSASTLYSERPTMTFTILGGEDFQKRMLTPIPVAAISLLAEAGWRGDRVLRMTVEELNGLKNAPRASGPTPATAPHYAEFLEAVGVISSLARDRMLSFDFERRRKTISSPIPTAGIDGSDLVNGAKVGVEFRATADGTNTSMTLEERVLVMRLGPRAEGSAEIDRFRELLRLNPNRRRFDFVELSDSHYDPLNPNQILDELAVNTRSLMGVLYYLSNGVQPPPSHEDAGIVTRTVDSGELPFDWSEMLFDLFTVHSSVGPPRGAAVAVRHRGHWFYIRDDDEDSKSTFQLLNQMFMLQAGDVEAVSPVLTLPVGG